MAPGRARDERKERQWRRWIKQWRASGLSVQAFCARQDLAPARFYHWRRVLERRAATEPTTFVPVQVVADAVPNRASALEVVLTDGRTVRVAPGFDAATLRQVLAVLEGRPC
ncbi:MAG TPA: IS66 family insertion sequence element accessory protein TnpB [Candidatus Limnocylindria bacterium]|nr:IS66 family insertion sequence element accessory protein TnpB [Candidatus Limnocylindria bacterium]